MKLVICYQFFAPINVTEYSLRETDEVSRDNVQGAVKGTVSYNPLSMPDFKPWQGIYQYIHVNIYYYH